MSLEGWKAFFEIGGVVLLLLTFASGAGALIVNNRLNAIQAKELGDFRIKFEEEQQKTALAQREAAEAKQIAGGFEIAISTANQRAAEANAKAEGFRLDIAKANEQAAKLEKEAVAAKLETEKLKQVVAWRIIPPEATAKLEKVLSGRPGSVNLRYTDGDPEALFLAVQVSQVLGKAKWQVAPGAVKFSNAIQFGVALPDSTGADAQTLRSAFEAAKISFSIGPLPQGGSSFSVSTIPGAPTLMIGSRMPVQIP
jgi:hypothetical protein